MLHEKRELMTKGTGVSSENVSQYLSTLQYLVHDIELIKSSMDKQDSTLNTWIENLKINFSKFLKTTISGDSCISLKRGITFDEPDVVGEIAALEKVLLTFLTDYQKLLHTYEEQALISPIQDLKDRISEFTGHPAIKKISLFLIHEDIYTLTKLIHYYSDFEYFTVYPFFSISHLLSEIQPETDGLLLISSGIIKENPLAVLMNIRDITLLMPILVIQEEEEAFDMQSYTDTGYNGSIRKECQISDLLDLFLTGLRDQAIIYSDIQGG